MKISFKNVGRDKKNWESEMESLQKVPAEARKHGGLMSRDVDYDFDDETQTGVIVVGGFREVGTFRVVDKFIVNLDA